MLGIIKMNRDEYRKGNLAVRDYRITLFGFPIYVARLTSTNRDAIIKLTSMEEKTLHICGFSKK